MSIGSYSGTFTKFNTKDTVTLEQDDNYFSKCPTMEYVLGDLVRMISKFDQKNFFQLKPDSDRVLSTDSEYRP